MTSARQSNGAIAPADVAALLFLGAVWGGAFLFYRIVAPEVGPLWTAEVRVGIAAVALLAVVGRPALRAVPGRIGQFAFLGLTFSAIPFVLIGFATLTLPTGLAALLNATTPLFTALVGAIWLGTRISPRVVAGIGVGLASVLVLVGWSPLDPGPATFVAAAASLGSAFSYAIAGTFVRRHMADVRPIELAAGQMTASALILLPVALVSGPLPVPSPGAAVSLLTLGLASTAVAWPLFFRVLGRTTPTTASTVTFIVPGFGILWGALFLGEAIGPGTATGFALVLVSLVLVLGIRIPLSTTGRRLAILNPMRLLPSGR
jgi:drug/metabolite transporter (DMT)-like permease